MSKYTVKNKKKQDIMDKSTKKKRKNGVLAYFMEKLVSENLVSENTLELEKECNTFRIMMAYLKQEEKKEFIFLTLTAPNVPADELNDEIKHYNQSFQRLMQRKEVKQIVKGYARKLEITYNEERDDYHPHFHVLIAVNK